MAEVPFEPAGHSHSLMQAMWTVAPYRTASSGRDCPVAFQPVDRALHGVAFAIVDGVNFGDRPPREPRLRRWEAWSFFSAMVHLIPRPRR